MNGIDMVIPCPYCRRPSSVWTFHGAKEGRLGHHCPSCGDRELTDTQLALGWARGEAVCNLTRTAVAPSDMMTSIAFGQVKDAMDIEPLYRHGGRWYGRTTGVEYDLPSIPEDECERFGMPWDSDYTEDAE